MKHFRVMFFFLAVALTLSGCGIFGGSDGTDLSAGEDVTPPPTVNSVQQLPAAEEPNTDAGGGASDEPVEEAGAALPTAVTLPTAAPSPEPTVDRSQPTSYVVQSGDVLGLIAERFDADIAELRRVNGLDGNLIQVGQTLTIPAADGSTTETADEAPEATSPPASSSGSGSSGSSAPVSCNSAATGHCVQPGESLLGIALEYDVTVEELRQANPGISGDLIKSGEVLNLPGSGATTTPDPDATAAPVTPVDSATPDPAVTVGPINDADCKARNPEFPFFHAADGLCYANPIGGATAVPTVAGGDSTQDCGPGRFLWEDGLCYPIPGVTVTPTPGPTTAATSTADQVDYGRPPCDAWEVVLITTNKCWPDAEATDEQKEQGRVKPATPTPTATATS